MHRTKVRLVEDALDASKVIDEIDLVAQLPFDVDRLEANILQVDHHARMSRVGARTGEGVDERRAWLRELSARVAAESAHEHGREHGPHDHAGHEPGTA